MIKRIYLEITLICVFLIIFLFIHSDLLFFNKLRCVHDTFASYSQFYYALNSFRNVTLPLWDPYTHGGQPFYYHFVKIPGGELSVVFFSVVSQLFKNISILMLYNYQITLHFLIFVLGCFYLARIIFRRRIISYYVLILGLFDSHFGSILGQDGAIIAFEFLPWLMAFFIIFFTGRAFSYHLIASIIISLLYLQTILSFSSFYFFVSFCIFYFFFCRKQLLLSKMHWSVWVFAAFILCLGSLKTFVLLPEVNNIFPSFRVFSQPSTIGKGINLAFPLGKASSYFRDYLCILNPLIGRYGGGELKFYLGFIPAFFAFYAIFALRNKFIWALAIPGALSLLVALGHKIILSFCFYVIPFFKSLKVMELFGIAPVYISFLFISAFGFEGILEKIDNLRNLGRFWMYIQKYLLFFVIIGLIITTAYIYRDHNGLVKSSLVLSYCLIPVIGIVLFYFINRRLQKFRKNNRRVIFLLGSISLLIMALVILSRPFFTERLMYFKMNRLIPIFVAFCIIISCTLFFYNKKHSFIIAIFCLGVIFIDLVFFTGLSTYTRLEKRGDLAVPERTKSFEYQKFRMRSFWPANVKKVYFLRPAMLYLQSSIITEEKFYSHGILIFTKNREHDFYMLNKFWDGYQRFPERIKRVVMGIDIPKLAFFTDYKEMDDEAVFKECENLDPELLRRFVYLAPDNYEVPPLNKTSLEQIPSAKIEVEHFDNNRLRLSVDTEEEGLLYYSDGYDKNWRCYIDGKQQPIRRANIAFKAVFVPEGRHTVLFVYRPIFYLVSFWSFLAACTICLISVYLSWLWRL